MKTCPACRSSIDAMASVCPKCRTRFSMMQMESGMKESRRHLIFKLVAILIVIAVVVNWLNSGGTDKLAVWTTPKQEGE